MSLAINNLYPEIEPFNQNHLKVSQLHDMYYEQCGNPTGIPVVFLHGGPGSGCNSTQRRFFDPTHYRVILLDQRGCGRSTPQGEVKENTTDDLVNDIEALRQHLNIAQWHVFGGSWGSSLALAYAVKHANTIISMVLRGIFLSRASELAWFLGDVKHFQPEGWHRLISYLPENEREDVLTAFASRIFSDDAAINIPAAIHWNSYESNMMRLLPSEPAKPTATVPAKTADELSKENVTELARARVQIHYIRNQCFIDGDAILKSAITLNAIPTVIVQGRYDMVCPPLTAWQLTQAMPAAKLVMVADAGHSAMELGILNALIAATEQFKSLK
ncbi:MAG: prolyl aminopeptidase [Bdellovibrio sp.]|nr:prolyl aminopeptidase [Methylotenera sp.]